MSSRIELPLVLIILISLIGTVRMQTTISSNITTAGAVTSASCTLVTLCSPIPSCNSTNSTTAAPASSNCTTNGTCCLCLTTCASSSGSSGGSNSGPPPAPAPISAPVNAFANVDPRLCFALTVRYPTATPDVIATYASNVNTALTALDTVSWATNCRAAQQLNQFLEDQVLLNNDNGTLFTFTRLGALSVCKPDCNFNRLLSKANTIFSINTTDFALRAMDFLPSNVGKLCRRQFPALASLIASPTASYLTSNLNTVSMLTPGQMGSFSQSDSVLIAQSLSTNSKQIPPALANSLGARIPSNQSLSDVVAIASAIPLAIFNNTAASRLVDLVGSMDLSNMNSFRKNFIATKIASSGNATIIKSLLTSSSDASIVSSIPSSLFSSLSIDISTIPAANIPKAYLKSYARNQVANLATITDTSNLAKILPGVVASDLNAITSSTSKVTVVTNLANGGISNGIIPTSTQRAFMLNNLLIGLSNYVGTTNMSLYLGNLTTDQIGYLYPLFIEANSTVLAAFAKLSTFSTVISKVSLFSSSQCCNFPKSARRTFATYAIPYLFSYTSLSLSDLYKLGPCVVSALPSTYLSGISSSVFSSYFPTMGIAFQPDSSEITVVRSLIATIASNSSTNQDTLVFSTLSDMAMFYDFSASYASNISTSAWTSSGQSLLSTIKAARDPTDSSVQMCQLSLGSSNTASLSNYIATYGSSFVTKYISSLSSKRSASSLTCSELNDMSSSLNTLSISQLASISSSEFVLCQTLLGASSNKWSSSQLTQLATTAKAYYVSASSISDTNIAALNSIMLGFSTADLSTLVFSSTTSITALGALSGWSTAQLTALATPISTYITSQLGGVISTDFITAAGNLMCCLTQTQINSVSSSVFSLAVTSLAKISLTCPNMGFWYTYAKSNGYSSVTSSTSALTELGSILTGITTADIQLVSSESISSITSTAWQYMPATVVNSLSLSQLNGLSSDQITALTNSPNYASFSSTITGSLSSLANGGSAATSSGTRMVSNINFLSIATLISVIILNLNF